MNKRIAVFVVLLLCLLLAVPAVYAEEDPLGRVIQQETMPTEEVEVPESRPFQPDNN